MRNIQKNNIVANSPFYAEIFTEYNKRLAADGKVNSKNFFAEVVAPRIPNLKLITWYSFLKRHRLNGKDIPAPLHPTISTPPEIVTEETKKIIATNQESTAKMVQNALFLAAESSKKMIEHPELATEEDRKNVELGIKIMKAQDSRIHAIGKIKEDSREEEKLNRIFNEADYG